MASQTAWYKTDAQPQLASTTAFDIKPNNLLMRLFQSVAAKHKYTIQSNTHKIHLSQLAAYDPTINRLTTDPSRVSQPPANNKE